MKAIPPKHLEGVPPIVGQGACSVEQSGKLLSGQLGQALIEAVQVVLLLLFQVREVVLVRIFLLVELSKPQVDLLDGEVEIAQALLLARMARARILDVPLDRGDIFQDLLKLRFGLPALGFVVVLGGRANGCRQDQDE